MKINHSNKSGKIYDIMILKKFINFLNSANISLLVIVPALLAILIPASLSIVVNKLFKLPITDSFIGLVGSCSGYLASLSGLVQIYRRESPGFIQFYGIWPIVMGTLWFIFCFVLATISLILGVTSLING